MTDFGRVAAHKTTHQNGGRDELSLAGITPGVHKTTHQAAGTDQLDTTALLGRADYVNRGDPTAADWNVSTLTADEQLHDLDLSSIVPVGTKAVHFRIHMQDENIGALFLIQKKGNTQWINVFPLITQVANLPVIALSIVSCDDDRKCEYYITNTVLTTMDLTVCGWFV